jgi:hypothetical protein
VGTTKLSANEYLAVLVAVYSKSFCANGKSIEAMFSPHPFLHVVADVWSCLRIALAFVRQASNWISGRPVVLFFWSSSVQTAYGGTQAVWSVYTEWFAGGLIRTVEPMAATRRHSWQSRVFHRLGAEIQPVEVKPRKEPEAASIR